MKNLKKPKQKSKSDKNKKFDRNKIIRNKFSPDYSCLMDNNYVISITGKRQYLTKRCYLDAFKK